MQHDGEGSRITPLGKACIKSRCGLKASLEEETGVLKYDKESNPSL